MANACIVCGRPTPRSDAKFCSRECYGIHASSMGGSYTCESCGLVVPAKPSNTAFDRKYCSWKCVPQKAFTLTDWQSDYILTIEASLRRKYAQIYRGRVEPYELEDIASEGILGAMRGISDLEADSTDKERFDRAFSWGLKAAQDYVRRTLRDKSTHDRF